MKEDEKKCSFSNFHFPLDIQNISPSGKPLWKRVFKCLDLLFIIYYYLLFNYLDLSKVYF